MMHRFHDQTQKKGRSPKGMRGGVRLHSFQPIDIHVIGVLEILVKDAHLQVILANPGELVPDVQLLEYRTHSRSQNYSRSYLNSFVRHMHLFRIGAQC